MRRASVSATSERAASASGKASQEPVTGKALAHPGWLQFNASRSLKLLATLAQLIQNAIPRLTCGVARLREFCGTQRNGCEPIEMRC